MTLNVTVDACMLELPKSDNCSAAAPQIRVLVSAVLRAVRHVVKLQDMVSGVGGGVGEVKIS